MNFDEDYFERGIETGKSCYQNYRWIPELTIPMAMTIIDYLGIRRGETILDYGCAKGFLVKAFRLLYREAWGVDISDYAIRNVDPAVKDICFRGNYSTYDMYYDFCIAKDVFEHIPEIALPDTLKNINAGILFSIIPLGGDMGYIAPSNNFDHTHVVCRSEEWWSTMFISSGWEIIDFVFRIDGIKDTYYKTYPKAHGFFVLGKEGTS